MKKFISIILCIIICYLSVSCTGGTGTLSEDDILSRQQSSVSEELSLPDTSDNETSAPVLPPSSSETEIKGLYNFENGIDCYGQNIDASISDGIIRFEYITPGLDESSLEIVTYSLSEDKTLGKVTLPESAWLTGKLNAGGFYAISLSSYDIIFYDRYCNETYRTNLNGRLSFQNLAAVSGDGKYMIYNRSPDGQLIIYTFATDNVESIYDLNGIFENIGYENGYFYLRNPKYGIFKISPFYRIPESVYINSTTCFATTEIEIDTINSYFVLTPLDDTANRRMSPMRGEYETPVAACGNLFATVEYKNDDSIIRVYDIQERIVSPMLNVAGTLQKTLFCENGLLLIISADTISQTITYYLYDLTGSEGYDSINISEIDNSVLYKESVPKWKGDAETIALAQSILDTYGVRVLFGKDDFGTELFSFSFDPVDDDSVLPKMQALSQVLAYFPEGMTKDIGGGKEIWVYLCSNPHYTDTNDGVAGFATRQGYHFLILLDTVNSDSLFCSTLVHEMSHIIDYSVSVNLINSWIDL
ncbi:MAG: hypothetical protein EOM87_08320, partial [Clostridia bacterium]|nr:hypothetical protein [Clostridia bacterium]